MINQNPAYQQIQEAANWFNQRLPDGGPIYAETDLSRIIVEPWNAITSLFILIPSIYWFLKIKGELGNYRFLFYAIILVILGGLGSALFHGFRASLFFLLMDVLPSALLSISVSIYLWLKVLKRWWYLLLIIIPLIAVRFFLFEDVPQHLAINIGYFMTGIMVVLPLFIVLHKSKYQKYILAVGAVSSFLVALIFRQLDAEVTIIPIGTHFLWHTFSAIGANFVLGYLYFLSEVAVKKNLEYHST